MAKASERSHLRPLGVAVIVVAVALAGLAALAAPAGAYSGYKHDGATSCGSCHPGGDTSVPLTDANCTSCHTGFSSRSVTAARTCWNCHDPGESMSTVQTGAGCAAGCHTATPHLGASVASCTSCHGVTQSATDRGTSAHHEVTTVYSAPTCGDCHTEAHTDYGVAVSCTTCHTGVTPTHPTSAAMVEPAFVFTATPAVVKYGGTSVLAGSLKNGATPLVGTTVTLQQKAAGAAGFTDVTSAVTGADGAFSFAAVSPTGATTYRVWAPGAVAAATTVRPAAKSATVSVAPILTIGINKTSFRLGGKVTAKGTLTPLRPGGSVKVVIQKKGTTWKTVKTVTRPLDVTGGLYSYTYKPLKRGTYRVQASAVATVDLVAVKSVLKTFKVK